MKKRINVTQKDIELGVCGDSVSCPIARAVKRHLKSGLYPSVVTSYFDIFSSTDIESRNIALPKKAETFISNFDHSREVKPFSFTVNISDKVLK